MKIHKKSRNNIPGLIRISAGAEHIDDIRTDLENAFEKIEK